ncbi:ATP-binding cassette sub-family A member 1-like [Tropilaelaps mercedesae]|uniref:ATP-binding cassette sub-family A member 1-like n=1 Tax=Tropilaelaps mercedesae TaxID=418985 RepID=A0A1V9XE22_9ACAR|nr:ATP-binding cassette sub-family A member 1-like [Tropilaelaps mercedesae]
MGFWRQLSTLLYKDVFIRKIKRHYFVFFVELLMPTLLVLLAMVLRNNFGESKARWHDAMSYDPMGPFTSSDVALKSSSRVAYAPNGAYFTTVMNEAFPAPRKRSFTTVPELNKFLANESGIDLAIAFASDTNPSQLAYTLQFSRNYEMGVGEKFDFSSNTPRPLRFYEERSLTPSAERSLLWPTMYAIFKAHLNFYNKTLPEDMVPRMRPFPSLEYFADDSPLHGPSFYSVFGSVTGSLIPLCFLFFLSTFAQNNITEKKSRLREMMRMMGLSDAVYWINAVLVGLVPGLAICLILTAGMCFGPNAAIRLSDASLVFCIFVTFTIGAILFVLLVCTLINSPKAGSLLTVLSVLGCWVLVAALLDRAIGSTLMDYVSKPASIKVVSSLAPFIGIYWLLKLIMYTEETGVGLHWSTLADEVIRGDNVTPLSLLLTMVFSWGIYLLLILYLDAIIPWQYGMPKHPLFFLEKSYWISDREESMRLLSPLARDSFEDFEMVEPAPNAGQAVIRLRHVSHNFGPVRAVNDLSLDLYANQITMLLGHNGAGKTTAMNILTGLFAPSEGEVYINGFNVRKETRKARAGVGLCLQHNVLFNELTVYEHLDFFANLKDAPRSTIAGDIQRFLEKLGLTPKVNTLAKNLSGGMKRKLSLANAMIGGSQILILDEPTAGMDPEARREAWAMLQEERLHRTVLMTTHYMEEADVLGDRIAFVAKGHLMCAGSPMFLKKKFETGYKLTLTKSSQTTDVHRALTQVKRLLEADEGVYIASNLGYEFCINIGFPEPSALINLFKELEQNKENLGIESIGISATTMEDVFLKIKEYDEVGISASDSKSKPHLTGGEETIAKFERIPSGLKLILRQMQGLLIKRFHVTRREWKVIWYLVMLPILLTVGYCSFCDTSKEDVTQSVTYSLKEIFGETKGFLVGLEDDIVSRYGANLRRDGVAWSKLPDEDINAYLIKTGRPNPNEYRTQWSAGGNSAGNRTLWFNGEPYHMGAAALARWQEAVLTKITGMDNSSVRVTNRPLGEKHDQPPILDGVLLHIQAIVFISVVAAYLISAAIMFPVQERVTKSKLVQLMSGVNRLTYITSNFLFDFAIMLVPIVALVLICVIMNPREGFRTFPETWVALLFVLVTYAVSMLPLIYALSYLFKSPASALSTIQSFAVLPVIFVGIVVTVVDIFSFFSETRSTYWIKLASFLPGFAVTYAFGNIHVNGRAKRFCSMMEGPMLVHWCENAIVKDFIEPCCHPCPSDHSSYCFKHTTPFTFDPRNGIMFQIMAMCVFGVIGFVLLVLMETYSQHAVVILELINYQTIRNALTVKGIRRLFSTNNIVTDKNDDPVEPEDSDVVEERAFVEEALAKNTTSQNALVVHRLTKYYGTFRAVNGISFSVRHKECFGLLGVNGAGKSSTFGLLTGDLLVSQGNAYIENSDLRSNLSEFQGYIGYCPQENALLDCMTGREMLALFCALRGVPQEQTATIVNHMIELADLTALADKLTSTYSGGNKRKLSIAIAMIGNPRMLYLDEPTAGVDPIARRKIWSTLIAAQRDLGSAVLLTSHSMEECEALCHRIAIMVSGTLRCLGSSQHLKAKFSQGFTVLVKLADDSTVQEKAVCKCMDRLFLGRCQLKRSHQRLLKFHVTSQNLPWSEVFKLILKLRTEPGLAIEDVQVSDTTLEEVFFNFAHVNTTSSPDGDMLDGPSATQQVHI